MAILKMKKLSVTVLASQKDELLRKLIKFGWVQFNDQSSAELPENLSTVSSSLITLKSEWNRVNSAIAVLDRTSPEKTPLLSAKPEVTGDLLLDPSGIETALSRADKILEADDRIKKISGEESRQRALMASLEPWRALDFRLGSDGTETSSAVPGTLPKKAEIGDANSALLEAVGEAELWEIGRTGNYIQTVLICLRGKLPQALEVLRPFGFSQISFQGVDGTAKDGINLAQADLNRLAAEKEELTEMVQKSSEFRQSLQLTADKLDTAMRMAEEEEKLLATDSTVTMNGWVPAEKLDELEKLLSAFVCAWDTEDPTEEEYPEVPVKLKNNRFTNGLNMVTDMYSLPQYGTVDPNPLMAPFFILFYGLMMADMGYGILMIVAALVAMKKMKPRDGTLSFCQLLLWGGIATFVMGALTGAFFSDIPYQIDHLLHPDSTWEGLPALFSAVRDSETVLYGSMVLGALHLNTGLAVSFVQKVKAGKLADAIWEEGSLWVLLIGGILAVLKIGNIGGVPALLIAALVMLLFGAGRNAKGFGKVTAAFGCIYNTATGWFGDVLSYSRIMALMLAGGVVGQVFNTVAIMPASSSGLNVFTGLAFVVIFLLGHAMNFALNLLGCYVHDLRLQCLEFFGKFYVDGGKPFRPLKFGGKYVRAKEN